MCISVAKLVYMDSTIFPSRFCEVTLLVLLLLNQWDRGLQSLCQHAAPIFLWSITLSSWCQHSVSILQCASIIRSEQLGGSKDDLHHIVLVYCATPSTTFIMTVTNADFWNWQSARILFQLNCIKNSPLQSIYIFKSKVFRFFF
jgi:hypothetical protein